MAYNGNDIDLKVHVLKTLLYYDVFSYPLKSKEVFNFLGTNSITEADVQHTLDALVKDVVVYRFNDLYSIHSNESNIERRLAGNKEAEKYLDIARKKARLISKPEPQYTEDARRNQIVGTVVLKVVFSSSGTVTNIRTVSGLPYGLTERAIAAARLIKFVPATKDGHQVSMWMQLEYNFNLY